MIKISKIFGIVIGLLSLLLICAIPTRASAYDIIVDTSGNTLSPYNGYTPINAGTAGDFSGQTVYAVHSYFRLNTATSNIFEGYISDIAGQQICNGITMTSDSDVTVLGWHIVTLNPPCLVTRTTGLGFGIFSYTGGYTMTLGLDSSSHIVATFYGSNYPSVSFDGSTHFISTSPENGTTTATTTTIGANIYANGNDFPNYGRLHIRFTQDGAIACQNSGAVYDAVYTCAGENSPGSPFSIDFDNVSDRLLAGNYNLATTTTFTRGGKWTAAFEIQQVSEPWYFLGLFHSYNTIVSQTVKFTVGQKSPIDIVREEVASSSEAFASSTRTGIGKILASTTASLINACNPIGGGFNPGDCLTLVIWPGEQALSDDLVIIKQTPPWGYVFRIIDLIQATSSTTTLPSINYSFSSTSPMAVMGNIHFDPFGSVVEAGALIKEMRSDQVGAPDVWTIMMPIVNIFVYMVLIFMIIHDLTGIHWAEVNKGKNNN